MASAIRSFAQLLTVVLLLAFAGSAWAAGAKEISIYLGESKEQKIDIPKEPGKKIKIETSQEGIVDIIPKKGDILYLRALQVGFCTILIRDESSKETVDIVEVTVLPNINELKEQISYFFKGQEDIKVSLSNGNIILSGTVSGPEIMEQVLRVTQTFVSDPYLLKGKGEPRAMGGIFDINVGPSAVGPAGGQGTGRSGMGIVNLLKVGGVQQVLLEVKFAEVTRASGRDWQAALGLGGLGSDLTGAAGVGQVTQTITSTAEAPFPGILPGGFPVLVEDATAQGLIGPAGSLLLNFADNASNVFINIGDLTLALQFLETEGLARTLAEPRLVTLSGQEASFLAGGEFPIPVPQDNNTITIEYKEFGVALRFTPVVMSDGKISLRVSPSVSDIASTSTIPSGIIGANFVVPNLTSRKLETTVHLSDGQTLALAGLLQDNIRETVRKVPGLGDIPILGALFRSSSFNQEKTDLLVAVTPHLVKPNQEGSLHFPGEYFQIPNRFEYYLEGRMEGRRLPDDEPAISRHGFTLSAIPTENQGGLEGDFGSQPLAPQK